MTFDELMELVVKAFEISGVIVLAIGSAGSLLAAIAPLRRADWDTAYRRVRYGIGRSILLGLELLIIADIVLTITIETTIQSAVALGLIVLVRTFLSFSLEIELEGTLPWRLRRQDNATPAELERD